RESDEEAVHGRADRGDPAGRGVGAEAGGGGVPAARHQRADVLRLAAPVRRDGRERGASAARAGEGERPAQAAAGRARRRAGRGEGAAPKKVTTSDERREAVAFLVERELSQRRACELLGVGRRWLGYRGKRARTDDPVLPRLKELAARHPRYGYRRLPALLRREGLKANAK